MSGLFSPLAFKLALRELRPRMGGGWGHLRLFIICLALGVAIIAAVLSTTATVLQSLKADGRNILGGDISVRVLYEPIASQDLSWLAQQGRVAQFIEMRSLVRSLDEQRSSLVELKATGENYPLTTGFILAPALELQQALAQKDGIYGAVLEDTLLTRLSIKIGERLKIGTLEVEVRAIVQAEPDRAGSGSFALGPRFIISTEALAKTGLLQQGSLAEYHYRLLLPASTDVSAMREAINARPAATGWQVRDLDNAAPQLRRFVEQFGIFLSLVGLTSLLIGGIGIGNAARAYLLHKLAHLAILKSLGAEQKLVFLVFGWQFLLMSAAGILLGLGLGIVLPLMAAPVLQNILPLPLTITPQPAALLQAALFGFLTSLAFCLWPLGQAVRISPQQLFRSLLRLPPTWPQRSLILLTALAALALATLAVMGASQKIYAVAFIVGSLVTLLLFRLMAAMLVWLAANIAKHLPRARQLHLALALGNLYRPGNAVGVLSLSLGLGLTALVAVGQIEHNLSARLGSSLPADSPSFFFVDIQPQQLAPFNGLINSLPNVTGLNEVPSLRGRITSINGKPAEQALTAERHAWMLRSDRGITYAAKPPKYSDIIAGQWWPENYQGPPLISVYKDLAEAFGIGIGDEVGFTILGRNITAKIGSIRQIDWSTFNLNFTVIFSPGVLDNAPHTWLATVQTTTADADIAVQQAVINKFSNITPVRVKEALSAAQKLLQQMGIAVQVIALLTLITGGLVMAGAMAADQKRRRLDAVILKALGTTRGDILRILTIEFALLGIMVAVLSIGLGTLAAYATQTYVMNIPFSFAPMVALAVVAIGLVFALCFGIGLSLQMLRQKVAPLLRHD